MLDANIFAIGFNGFCADTFYISQLIDSFEPTIGFTKSNDCFSFFRANAF